MHHAVCTTHLASHHHLKQPHPPAPLPAFAEAAFQVLSEPSPTLREMQRLEFVHLMCFALESLAEALPVSAWPAAAAAAAVCQLCCMTAGATAWQQLP